MNKSIKPSNAKYNQDWILVLNNIIM